MLQTLADASGSVCARHSPLFAVLSFLFPSPIGKRFRYLHTKRITGSVTERFLSGRRSIRSIYRRTIHGRKGSSRKGSPKFVDSSPKFSSSSPPFRFSMNKSMSSDFYDQHLRSFPPPKPLLDHEDVPFFGSLPELLRSVKKLTGRDVVFVRAGGTLPGIDVRCFPVKVDGGKSPGHLVLLPGANDREASMNGIEQEELLASLALLLGDAYRWQQLFRKYEEELASVVPVPSLKPTEKRFSTTLYEILKGGAKILDCCAASLYMLDEASKSLKLRSCWGLPEERLLDPPRKLHDSLADIEAMLGQAVVLNEDFLLESWMSPESFPTAVCIPVSSSMSILGTLWIFADERRDIDEREIALMEIIAGRIAAELERVAVLRELSGKGRSKRLA